MNYPKGFTKAYNPFTGAPVIGVKTGAPVVGVKTGGTPTRGKDVISHNSNERISYNSEGNGGAPACVHEWGVQRGGWEGTPTRKGWGSTYLHDNVDFGIEKNLEFAPVL